MHVRSHKAQHNNLLKVACIVLGAHLKHSASIVCLKHARVEAYEERGLSRTGSLRRLGRLLAPRTQWSRYLVLFVYRYRCISYGDAFILEYSGLFVCRSFLPGHCAGYFTGDEHRCPNLWRRSSRSSGVNLLTPRGAKTRALSATI